MSARTASTGLFGGLFRCSRCAYRRGVAPSCVSPAFFGWPPDFAPIACGEEKEGDTCEEKQKRPG